MIVVERVGCVDLAIALDPLGARPGNGAGSDLRRGVLLDAESPAESGEQVTAPHVDDRLLEQVEQLGIVQRGGDVEHVRRE